MIAGERIDGPIDVLKEMIENSLDARASSISITILTSDWLNFQVEDNGHGINVRVRDYPGLIATESYAGWRMLKVM